MRLLLVVLLFLALALGGAMYGIRTGAIPIRPEWNPWAVLEIQAQPNFLTRYKLHRLSKDSALCQQVLATANITYAEALDIAGFVLEDGQRIRVLKDWPEAGERAAFLREVRSGACRFFDGVLSPDYNAAHRDHFHFDRGPYRVCR